MKRAFGSGSIYEQGEGRWVARVYLIGGKRKMRRRRSREEAEAAIQEMFEQYAGQLGYFTNWPRPYHYGKGPKVRRKGISLRVRYQVLERDGFRCVYCGNTANDARLVIDHVQPIADGGTNALDNLVTACQPCNAGKAGRPLLNHPVLIAAPVPPATMGGQ